MMPIDTGPLVALFDPRHDAHQESRLGLEQVQGPAATTVQVLTELSISPDLARSATKWSRHSV